MPLIKSKCLVGTNCYKIVTVIDNFACLLCILTVGEVQQIMVRFWFLKMHFLTLCMPEVPTTNMVTITFSFISFHLLKYPVIGIMPVFI